MDSLTSVSLNLSIRKRFLVICRILLATQFEELWVVLIILSLWVEPQVSWRGLWCVVGGRGAQKFVLFEGSLISYWIALHRWLFSRKQTLLHQAVLDVDSLASDLSLSWILKLSKHVVGNLQFGVTGIACMSFLLNQSRKTFSVLGLGSREEIFERIWVIKGLLDLDSSSWPWLRCGINSVRICSARRLREEGYLCFLSILLVNIHSRLLSPFQRRCLALFIGHFLLHLLKYLRFFMPLHLFRIVPIKIDILWPYRTYSCLRTRCLFWVHSREHARFCVAPVILSVWRRFVVNTIDLIHQIFVSIAVLLHMVVTVTRLYSLQPILLSEGDLKWRLTLADIVVSVHSLNDFVGIRRYVLQVVDLSFTHLDTYCYSLCTVLVVLLLLPHFLQHCFLFHRTRRNAWPVDLTD